ncbi:MAG: hypothetical protein NT120_02155 [Candidatus Aenigmarchaeota archaeon]|nr:hypothetical protein [Candidatus Aenigmarchaeota archaeon]
MKYGILELDEKLVAGRTFQLNDRSYLAVVLEREGNNIIWTGPFDREPAKTPLGNLSLGLSVLGAVDMEYMQLCKSLYKPRTILL